MTFCFKRGKEDDGFGFEGRALFFAGGGAAGRAEIQRVDSIAVNKARMMRNQDGLSHATTTKALFFE